VSAISSVRAACSLADQEEWSTHSAHGDLLSLRIEKLSEEHRMSIFHSRVSGQSGHSQTELDLLKVWQ